MPKIFNINVLSMKKSNIFKALKELLRDMLLVIALLCLLVFPFALIMVAAVIQQIICGN